MRYDRFATLMFTLLVWCQSSGDGFANALPESIAQDSQQVPAPDGADARDADTPDPQYADGSPGQYVLVGTSWPQPGGKGSPITLTYSFQNMFDGALKMPDGQPLPASLIRGSIQEALGLWASAAPLNFVEVPDNGSQFGTIRFRHVSINGTDPLVGYPIAKAQAYYPSTFGDLPGDVEFDEGDAWQEVGTLHQPDILGAAIHEIGHTLGLGHSTGVRSDQFWTIQTYGANNEIVDVLEPKGNANMFWIFTRYSGPGTGQLFTDDVAGIQAIYGAGKGSVTPLPAGSRQDIPILPDATGDGFFAFDDVPSGKWFGSPLASAVKCTAAPGTLFSEILNLPTGFSTPFVVSVRGEAIGSFGAGQSIDFQNYAGGGVTNFTISGIDPFFSADPLQFPLQIAFTRSMGGFKITAIPEPATWILAAACVIFYVAAASGRARTRARVAVDS